MRKIEGGIEQAMQKSTDVICYEMLMRKMGGDAEVLDINVTWELIRFDWICVDEGGMDRWMVINR